MSETIEPQWIRAEDNPWYRLATLYGEAPEEHGAADTEIANKNRIAWNRWVSQGFTKEQRARLLKAEFPRQELDPLSDGERNEIRTQFFTRSGHEKETAPDPKQRPNFNATHFDHHAYFDGFLFLDMSNFGSATFYKEAHFHGAFFFGDALFGTTTFKHFADFGEAHFMGAAGFDAATFSGTAKFERATFGRWVDFKSANFSGEAQFAATKFQQSASFELATFKMAALFRNAEFADLTRFVSAHFGSEVPDFRGAKLHEATEWHNVDWPPLPGEKKQARKQVYAYERLKQEMERLKKHEDEQMFFCKELRIRRTLAQRGSWPWLFNSAYAMLSNYGQSASWPLYWLLGTLTTGSLIFAFCPVTTTGTEMSFLHALSVNFAHIFSFFPIHREMAPPHMFSSLSWIGKIIVITESIAGPLLLFLVALAWRNQFRMK